jgi:DNA primase catalytic core
MLRDPGLADITRRIKETVTITGLLAQRGISPRRTSGGTAYYLCPLHAEDRPSFTVRAIDGQERFRCWGCAARGDVIDFVQALEGHPDYVTTLRALADRQGLPWPARNGEPSGAATRVLDAATAYYERELAGQPLAYLASRGFPEAFCRRHHIGYAPPRPGFGFTRYAEAQGWDQVAEHLGLIQKATDTRPRRDYFLGRIIFPNRSGRHTIDLQGRAFPDREPKYLNLPGARRRVYNADAAAHPQVILCEGIPDTLSVLAAGLPACGIYGTQGWSREYHPLFRRARRVYVALDRDATDRAITIAKDFGIRGRVLVPPPELGPKGDLNDWLVHLAGGDPSRFAALLTQALATSPTPWALAIDLLPDVPAWDRHEQLGTLLAELAPMPPVFRDAHLGLLAQKTGLPFTTLLEAARDLAHDTAEPPEEP